ncbi:MAG: hypothetical protein JWN70_4377, partial [Planctomycetaceae bacterium]|nr:hypothetical protein [Planctomycetaceae bacterium]
EPAKSDGMDKAPASAITAAKKTQHEIELALNFMVLDTAKWRQERVCATCHHGTLTVWALNEAKIQGYRVNEETLADVTQWTKDLFIPKISKPRDPRPGWSLVSTPGIYLGLMSYTLPVLSRDEINRVAIHLARHQAEDGSFEMPPPKNGAPPIWESPETLTLWALLAWEPYVPADPTEAAAARASREKTIAWLNAVKPSETPQASALRLLLDVRMGKSAEQLQPRIDKLLSLQKTDGGWSQAADLPSDAYATGQSLWALSFAGLKPDRPEIGRAVAFLVSTQREDGSWPMTSRNHPGVVSTRNPIRNPMPITYFGSAWATIGLVRSVPVIPDPVVQQKRAIDRIRTYGGKFDVDETIPDKPVVRADLRNYELDDMEVADFIKDLRVLPRLATLEFKSKKITDASLIQIKSMPQLRSLTLENAAITDAGLVNLKEMIYLEALNLKGTAVTDAGIKVLQDSLPKLKIER